MSAGSVTGAGVATVTIVVGNGVDGCRNGPYDRDSLLVFNIFLPGLPPVLVQAMFVLGTSGNKHS